MEDEVVIGDWIKERILGSGTFGIVSWWRNLKTDESLAIKICKWGNDIQLTEKHKTRWTKEVEMMNIFKNDNIVGTRNLPKELKLGLDTSNVSKLPILCMEYCSEGDLRQLLNKSEYGCGLSENQVRNILKDMKNAVSYLHQQKITHRDLKPENIVLQNGNTAILQNGKTSVIYKLIDLGYAKEIDADSVCASFVGTLQYLAPELLYSKTYSNTVDYWSLGLVAFEVICGIRPFLPNMPPVQWMNRVKNKTSEQICVFEDNNGDVQYSNTVFEENNISDCFRQLIEKWLRVALEWDPKKRGHLQEEKSVKFTLPGYPPELNGRDVPEKPSKEDSLVIFSLLDSILSRKILTLFSVATYEFLSYEVDDSTTFSTLQGWIERDTGVVVPNQLFLSSSRAEVDKEGFAHKHWNSNVYVMLYVYQKGCFFQEGIKHKIPKKVRYCLDHPKLKSKYSTLMETFTCTLYFVRNEKRHYESLLMAYNLMVEHLKQEIRKLFLNHNDSDINICKLNEKKSLLASILEVHNKQSADCNRDGRFTPYMEEYNVWSEKCKSILGKNSKLCDAWCQLTIRLQSVARRCNDIHDKDLYSQLSSDPYRDLQYAATQLVSQLKRVPKEQRTSLSPCIDAFNILSKCLSVRKKLLLNMEIQKMSQQIIDIHVETMKMSNLIVSAGQNAEELSGELTRLILEKESIAFRCINSLLDSISSLNGPSCIFPGERGTEGSQPSSGVMFKIGAAVTTSGATRPISLNTEELQSLIKDNMSLRLTSQSLLQKSYKKHKDIMQELDFSFLNES